VKIMKKTVPITVIMMFMLLGITLMAFAADDPSIKGERREGIQKAMQGHIEETAVHGAYVIYDAATDNLKRLQFKKLHTGIVKKADFYVSCVDFTDSAGKLHELDLLVAEEDGGFRVVESLVHKIGTEKRKYHLEELGEHR
jgi:hypothetical protein